jgi:hypothetical protein
MDRCHMCSRPVDTDFDLECYVDGTTQCRCQHCREDNEQAPATAFCIAAIGLFITSYVLAFQQTFFF